MKGKTISSIVIYGVILIVVFAVIALVLAFMNNGQKNFYVQYGNEKISYKAENMELPKNATSLFYCKNVLSFTDKQENVSAAEYTVTVQADKEKLSEYDFTGLIVDGKRTDFFKNVNLTKALDIVQYDGYFTLYLPETLTMYDMLVKIYGTDISGVPDIDLYEKEYLSLSVYVGKEKETITIGFH